MAHKIDCVCSKILNHGLNHGFSSFLCGKRSKLSENSGLKSRFLDFLIFQFYLICPFLSAQMALVSTFFQMFIALGMYNFGSVFE